MIMSFVERYGNSLKELWQVIHEMPASDWLVVLVALFGLALVIAVVFVQFDKL